MPSTITHSYISLDVYDKLNKNAINLIQNNLENFKSFAQGMDILYFYHFINQKNDVIKLGHRFHHFKTNEVFKYIIEYNKINNDPIVFALLSGLKTHYVADSTIHPYVNYLANNDKKIEHQNKHFEIETVIDNYMLKIHNENYQQYKGWKLQFNNKKDEKIVDLLNKLFEKFFNVKNIGPKYYKGLKEMRLVFKYFRYDKYGIKRKFYHLIDKNHLNVRRISYLSYHFNLDNLDYYLNTKHNEWYNIRNKNIKSNKSFKDLYNDVVLKASNIINNLYDYIYLNKNVDIDTLIGNNSYSNGLPLN